MSGFVISVYRDNRDGTIFGRTSVFHGSLDDAKTRGEELREEFPGSKVSIKGPRGGVLRLVPRDRNTGPGRWRWQRETA